MSVNNVSSHVVDFLQTAIIISLDDDIVGNTIELRSRYNIKLPDAIIAATAIVHDLTLVTHNIADFKKIRDLKLIDSHLIG